jgi:uncharacterized membrane protein YeaQ/YmgE (transglycosylase-associated protein family)
MEILGVIVAGIIIGLLGKFVAPGDKDNTPLWMTVLCGIGGVLIGWYVYTAFGGNGSPGVDWVRWIVAIVIAAVLVMVASTAMGRNSGSTRHVFKSAADEQGHRAGHGALLGPRRPPRVRL